jgi:hypothetical protein
MGTDDRGHEVPSRAAKYWSERGVRPAIMTKAARRRASPFWARMTAERGARGEVLVGTGGAPGDHDQGGSEASFSFLGTDDRGKGLTRAPAKYCPERGPLTIISRAGSSRASAFWHGWPRR